jgi:hypothetical protein
LLSKGKPDLGGKTGRPPKLTFSAGLPISSLNGTIATYAKTAQNSVPIIGSWNHVAGQCPGAADSGVLPDSTNYDSTNSNFTQISSYGPVEDNRGQEGPGNRKLRDGSHAEDTKTESQLRVRDEIWQRSSSPRRE